jgi:hypothetical protein
MSDGTATNRLGAVSLSTSALRLTVRASVLGAVGEGDRVDHALDVLVEVGAVHEGLRRGADAGHVDVIEVDDAGVQLVRVDAGAGGLRDAGVGERGEGGRLEREVAGVEAEHVALVGAVGRLLLAGDRARVEVGDEDGLVVVILVAVVGDAHGVGVAAELDGVVDDEHGGVDDVQGAVDPAGDVQEIAGRRHGALDRLAADGDVAGDARGGGVGLVDAGDGGGRAVDDEQAVAVGAPADRHGLVADVDAGALDRLLAVGEGEQGDVVGGLVGDGEGVTGRVDGDGAALGRAGVHGDGAAGGGRVGLGGGGRVGLGGGGRVGGGGRGRVGGGEGVGGGRVGGEGVGGRRLDGRGPGVGVWLRRRRRGRGIRRRAVVGAAVAAREHHTHAGADAEGVEAVGPSSRGLPLGSVVHRATVEVAPPRANTCVLWPR